MFFFKKKCIFRNIYNRHSCAKQNFQVLSDQLKMLGLEDEFDEKFIQHCKKNFKITPNDVEKNFGSQKNKV